MSYLVLYESSSLLNVTSLSSILNYREMPRQRYGKSQVKCKFLNGNWLCGVCGERKGKTKKDCEQHQGFCLRKKAAAEINLKFGIVYSDDTKMFSCIHCKYTTNKNYNAHRHVNQDHKDLIPDGLERAYIRKRRGSAYLYLKPLIKRLRTGKKILETWNLKCLSQKL